MTSANGMSWRNRTIQSWLSPQPPKRKAASQLYLFEVTAQEKEIIESGLRECQGRVFGPSGAAAKLRLAWSTLESKIRSLKIDKNRFSPIGELEGSRFSEIARMATYFRSAG